MRTPAGIVRLRSHLLDAIALQTRLEDERSKAQPLSSFFVEHKQQLHELGDSAYTEAVQAAEAAAQG